MLRSSLGFHTLTLFITLTWKEVKELLRAFIKYSETTGCIKIFPLDEPKEHRKLVYESNGKSKRIKEVKLKYRIVYHSEDIGIEWLIRYNNWSNDFQSYIVEVKINPKILSGIKDYLTAATWDDIETAKTNFNLEARRISSILKDFSQYKLKRIDYCVNFLLDELGMKCTPEKIMELIRRSDIPPHYKEHLKYSETSHCMKGDPASFYLKNNSANINCYSKYMELLRRSNERESKGLSPIPQITLEAARNILRFEIQCKHRKTYNMSNKLRSKIYPYMMN